MNRDIFIVNKLLPIFCVAWQPSYPNMPVTNRLLAWPSILCLSQLFSAQAYLLVVMAQQDGFEYVSTWSSWYYLCRSRVLLALSSYTENSTNSASGVFLWQEFACALHNSTIHITTITQKCKFRWEILEFIPCNTQAKFPCANLIKLAPVSISLHELALTYKIE